MSDPYVYERRGRTALTAIVVALVYIFLAVGLVYLNLSQWLVLIGFVLTLPAFFDLISDVQSGMTISSDEVSWFHGKKTAAIPLADARRFRIDLRMDRSVKLSIELENGRKIRVAQPATPPLKELEDILSKMGIEYRKNPFSLL